MIIIKCLFCQFPFPVFNISRAHQIEKNRWENRSCFAVSSFLVCNSIHHALQSDLNDRAIWFKTRGHLRQFMGWFDADCVVFQHDYMLWFALFFVIFWLSMLYKWPKTDQTLHRSVQPTRFPQDKTKQKANWQHTGRRLCHHDKRLHYTVFGLHALIRILSQAYGIPCNLPIKRQHKNCNCHFFFVTL